MLKQKLNDDLKAAMRLKESQRISTLRLILAAIKELEISARTDSERPEATDEQIIQILSKMVKQRRDSIRLYEEGGRVDLAEQEKAEIAVIEHYLPKQMSPEEVDALCAEVRDELNASGLKDMGRCMGVIKERYAGQLDMGEASKTMKTALT
ncbi:GatB/YqeY domain-containing protein [Minwuia sp.]|uniref:GatB/YqeY domain-containing protein n=1 Tax=Minwuia sp. TaxID=2493630 RepID=UPI003A9521F4